MQAPSRARGLRMNRTSVSGERLLQGLESTVRQIAFSAPPESLLSGGSPPDRGLGGMDNGGLGRAV